MSPHPHFHTSTHIHTHNKVVILEEPLASEDDPGANFIYVVVSLESASYEIRTDIGGIVFPNLSGTTHLVVANIGIHLQLLVQIAPIGTHPLTVVEPALRDATYPVVQHASKQDGRLIPTA